MSTTLVAETSNDPLDQAIAWHIELSDENCSAETHTAWESWYSKDSQHRKAWTQIQRLNEQFSSANDSFNPKLGHKVLDHAERNRLQRRHLLRSIVGLGLAVPLGWGIVNSRAYRNYNAEINTAVGEQRQITLADGSKALLNTDTHINVRLRPSKHYVELVSGELFIERPDAAPPLILTTDNGRIESSAHRLQLRHTAQNTVVHALQGPIDLHPRGTSASVLHEGHFAIFNDQKILKTGPITAADSAWQRGILTANDWQLSEFCNELERYVSGTILCTPAVAQLRLSGSFPIHQPQQLIHRLEKVLPVRITQMSPYLTIISQS